MLFKPGFCSMRELKVKTINQFFHNQSLYLDYIYSILINKNKLVKMPKFFLNYRLVSKQIELRNYKAYEYFLSLKMSYLQTENQNIKMYSDK